MPESDFESKKRKPAFTQGLDFFGSLENKKIDAALLEKVAEHQAADAGTDNEDLGIFQVDEIVLGQRRFRFGSGRMAVCGLELRLFFEERGRHLLSVVDADADVEEGWTMEEAASRDEIGRRMGRGDGEEVTERDATMGWSG